ncbi:TniQ family protein [Castellaniella sp.]|uniref:TniQ family protein n=1 Tax=Castellaniella sp. TaxID=1955812 RepID=UPI003A90DAEE
MTQVPSLLVLPDPILDESPASWMLRLCQYHQSWPNRVCAALGLQKMTDFDVQLSMKSLLRLAYGTAVDHESLICMDGKFLHIRQDEKRCAAFLLHGSSRGYATYRYCPACLREDPIPYWRLTWRMAYFQVCPKHCCALLDHCQACHATLEAAPTLKGGFFGGSDHHQVCRFCPACREDLGQFQAEVLSECEQLRRILALQDCVTAALLHGYFFISEMEGYFSLEDVPRVLMRGAVRYVSGGNGSVSGLHTARHASSSGGTLMTNSVGGVASTPVSFTSGGYPGDSLCRWAKMAWKARFQDVIEQIRSI